VIYTELRPQVKVVFFLLCVIVGLLAAALMYLTEVKQNVKIENIRQEVGQLRSDLLIPTASPSASPTVSPSVNPLQRKATVTVAPTR
jgi:hypothetical protein